jgi:hypothetical protein
MYLLLPDQILSIVKSNAHIYILKVAEDGLMCLLFHLPQPCLCHIINLLSLPFTIPRLWIWDVGASGQMSHVESLEFGHVA